MKKRFTTLSPADRSGHPEFDSDLYADGFPLDVRCNLTFRTSAVGFPRISVRANFGGGLGCGNDAGGCGPIRRGRLTATAIPLISGRSPQPPHPAHATRLVLDSGGALDRQGDGPARTGLPHSSMPSFARSAYSTQRFIRNSCLGLGLVTRMPTLSEQHGSRT